MSSEINKTAAPLFSVIILSFNNEPFIRAAIDSVLSQTYDNLELIVIDDFSAVFHAEQWRNYICENRRGNLHSFSILRNSENLGTVKSANRALKQSHGQYIKLLAADDALYDNMVLKKARKALAASRDGIVLARVARCSSDMRERGYLKDRFRKNLTGKDPGQLYRALCLWNQIAAPGMFFTRAFFDKYGCFDEQYRLLEDWPMWLRVTREGGQIESADFPAVKYRSDVGLATGLDAAYMSDKNRTYCREIRPYSKRLGASYTLLALMILRLRNSIWLRRAYGKLFRLSEKRGKAEKILKGKEDGN